jgi:hypothetical protein
MKAALDTAINDLRATLEAALVRDDDVNRCVAMLLFLKRLTDLADHPRAGTSFIPSEYQGMMARLSNFSWATIAKEDDPAGVRAFVVGNGGGRDSRPSRGEQSQHARLLTA